MISKRSLLRGLTISAGSFVSSPLLAASQQVFDQARFDAARASGAPILVFIAADWCPTCRAQGPIITQVSSESVFRQLQIFRLDFDRQKSLRRALRASRQSTLIAFKGGVEVGRNVGATNPAQIRALMQLAI